MQTAMLFMNYVGSANTMMRNNRVLAHEAAEGIRNAALVSGLPFDSVNFIEKVDTVKMFGIEEATMAIEAWDPSAAEFIRRNPNDPLVPQIIGEAGGVFVPRGHGSELSGTISVGLDISLFDAINARRSSKGSTMRSIAYHEAFHSVQDMLMASMESGDEAAAKMLNTMSSPEALAEMKGLARKSRSNADLSDAAPHEVQAEAFAWWLENRNYKMKARGLQGVFEKLKRYFMAVGKQIRAVLGKNDPTWRDVFEAAATGKISEKYRLEIEKMPPDLAIRTAERLDMETANAVPGLLEQIGNRLDQLAEEGYAALDAMDAKAQAEGC